MKNAYQEKLKIAAKIFHKNNRGEKFTNGVIIWHQYDEANMPKLSWWNEVSFILNDYLVQVAWIHPRMAFKDRAEDDAYKKVAHLDRSADGFMGQTKPNYVKVGQSRKKIISRTLTGSLLSIDWMQAFDAAYAEILKEADFKIAPFIKPEWVQHSRFVELCAPIEIQSERDLMALVNLVRKLLKRETTLVQEFTGYSYAKDDLSGLQKCRPFFFGGYVAKSYTSNFESSRFATITKC